MGKGLRETAFYEEISKIVPEERISVLEPLDKHISFKVGGPADYFIEVASSEEIAKLIYYFGLIDNDYYVLGNGTNMLVGDKGYHGSIISLHKHMQSIEIEGDRIICQAGATIAAVAVAAQKAGLKGLEFASGIPGTVGGAVVMNAGAYDGEISQIFESCEVVALNGNIITMRDDELMFGYRKSVFKREPLICTQVVFKLSEGDPDKIAERMDELRELRMSKQPLEYPSAGSTFKRPEGYFAGKLIMDSGLRGMQIGGARVSDKHCGFIVNVGGANASDILDLINEVQEIVKEKQGISLEPEICMLGDF